jgi:hypothetical protein
VNFARLKPPSLMTRSYIAVLVIEAAIIFALWWFGRAFS